MDSREELSQSSDLLDTPSSPTQSLLSNLSLTDDSTPDQNITTSLRVIGDVVDAIDSPVTLNIIYNNEIFTAGGEFLPSQVVSQPRVEVGGHLGTFYTLVIVNPDAPSPRNPSLKEYMHWLVTDIPGNSEASLGQEVVPYESPQPSIGIHRMVFVLLQQRGQQTVYPPGWRQNFNTRDFAEVYDLTPVAAVYFNCRREGDLGGSKLSPKSVG
ncbi:protein HEADING DATE 3A-like [Chenopodium quinoa]|uniref:protein HEADING DATE 3A-like n=1 Tax=Chenopodium quinoa TaxID=63459 RepID=UPI000B773CEA|nr:protein HEADING DATE 3A-like [Chenopodium quinoa]